MMPNRRFYPSQGFLVLWGTLVLVLAACTNPDGAPPSVSISSPAVGQTVSGIVQVQLSAKDASGITKVSLYARGKGTAGDGVAVGSATSEPLVVSWFTPSFPNQAELEVLALAEDGSSNFSQSDPVWVKTNNAGSPTFSYLIGYTLPPAVGASRVEGQGACPECTEGSKDLLPAMPDPLTVNPPVGWSIAQTSIPWHSTKYDSRWSLLDPRPLANATRSYVLRFGWNAVAGASGYRIYRSDKDLAGAYTNIRNQLAVGTGIQEYIPTLQTGKAGDKYWGAITAVISNSEGNYSNADETTLLPAQLTSAPAQDASSGNRPSLSWSATNGAQGYLFYIARKTQSEATPADWVCTNYPNSTDKLDASYPSACPDLSSGTYYWWVAGVSFNNQAVVDAYTFSDPVRFYVP